jgi:predicted site-specific integrase-resolvase
MPDRWQPIPLVAQGLGIPDQTIRTWVRRGRIESRRLPDGTLLVDTGAVLDRRYASSTRA